MPPKIEFVIYTGDTTIARKDAAHRKTVRSFVTAQHYREKRIIDVRKHEVQQQPRNSQPLRGPPMQNLTRERQSNTESRETLLSSTKGQYDVAIINVGSPTAIASASSDTASFGLDSDQRNRASDNHLARFPAALLSPYSYLGQGRGNPFAARSREFPNRMAKHLYYYVSVLMPQMHPSWTTSVVVRRFGCTALIVADDMILTALSAHAATARALMTGDLVRRDQEKTSTGSGFHDATLDWLYFKGKTIGIVNEKLSNTREAISDSTIVAISDLIMIEAFTGDLETAGAHVNGLKRILSMRQKDCAIPYSVTSMTAASIIKFSTLSQSKPPLPFTLSFPVVSLPLPDLGTILPKLGSTLANKWQQISATEDVVQILYDLATMTRYTEAIFEGKFPISEDDSYHEYANYQNLYIEHRLLSYRSARFGSVLSQTIKTTDSIEYCCILASLLHVNTSLWRGYPASSAIIHNMVRRLKEVLESIIGNETAFKSTWSAHCDVFIWVLFVGAYCSQKQGEETFFREALTKTATILGIASWEGVREMLQGFFFLDRIHLGVLREIMEYSDMKSISNGTPISRLRTVP